MLLFFGGITKPDDIKLYIFSNKLIIVLNDIEKYKNKDEFSIKGKKIYFTKDSKINSFIDYRNCLMHGDFENVKSLDEVNQLINFVKEIIRYNNTWVDYKLSWNILQIKKLTKNTNLPK